MRVDILEHMEVKRFTLAFHGRHYQDEVIHLNSGQQLNAKYVEQTSDGGLEIHVSDGSLIAIPSSLKESVRYESPEFQDDADVETISPPRGRSGGCCGGRR